MYSLEPSSFRDPSGFLFYHDDVLYRQINQSYKDDYDHLMVSRVVASKGIFTISFDIDPAAVEQNFLNAQKNKETSILPLLLDLANPSPSIGWANSERKSFMDRSMCTISIPIPTSWANSERKSFMDRGPSDVVLALALIHHLAIGNNLPLSKIAAFFQKISKFLIIEFIPKTDSQISRLLVTREDIFDNYTLENFEKEFENLFDIRQKTGLDDSERILYLMEKKVLA